LRNFTSVLGLVLKYLTFVKAKVKRFCAKPAQVRRLKTAIISFLYCFPVI